MQVREDGETEGDGGSGESGEVMIVESGSRASMRWFRHELLWTRYGVCSRELNLSSGLSAELRLAWQHKHLQNVTL